MEPIDFEMPSPKRQRTESPPAVETGSVNDKATLTAQKPSISATEDAPENVENNNILDALLQHVENESTPLRDASAIESVQAPQEAVPDASETAVSTSHSQSEPDCITDVNAEPVDVGDKARPNGLAGVETGASALEEGGDQQQQSLPGVSGGEQNSEDANNSITEDNVNQAHIDTNMTTAPEIAQEMNGIPPMEGGDPPVEPEGAEWEIDSSPYESSTDSDSSDDSSSDDSDDNEDADGDYAMLDPEEQARILMQGDAGSDDEGGAGKSKSTKSGYKTANEQLEDVPLIPDVVVTEEMTIEELGVVEAVVENNILIRAKVSGEYQVLESGSLLCFADRKVAGVVAETLGRVEQPLYTMRFQNEEDITKRNLARGKIIFYVKSNSSFVFTQPLKAVKGSDASNIHDEEVGDEEIEFSDDEAEAEHKRQMKLKRQGRLGEGGRGRGMGKGRGGRGGRGDRAGPPFSHDINGSVADGGPVEMNYDEIEEGEEGYTVLSRPNNLHEMMTAAQGSQTGLQHMPPPRSRDRGHGRGRGNNDRNRGRGNDRGSFRGRGNFSSPPHQNQQRASPNQYHNTYQNTGFSSPFQPPPPPPPMLAPQNSNYPGSFITSPISPLPQQQFNFGAAFPGMQYGGYPQSQPPPKSQQQMQQQHPNFNFHPGLMQQFAQQQQQQQQQQQTGNYGGQWQPNQAAVADVQRQLEEMRRAAGQSGAYHQQ